MPPEGRLHVDPAVGFDACDAHRLFSHLAHGPGAGYPRTRPLAQRDPSVITFWLSRRVEPGHLPDRPVVIAVDLLGPRAQVQWMVLERGSPPSICLEDPGLSPDRYIYVEALAAEIYPVSRGHRSWNAALADGSVTLYGDPRLVRSFPTWFGETDSSMNLADAQ